ncbi:MAG: hypothetical protein WC472_02120 [Candidatus Paceibacterota bacterium]
MASKHKNRILIKTEKGNKIKRLFNIQSIYKNDKLYEYKITFEGFPKKRINYVKDVVIDTVNGIKKFGKQKLLSDRLEVSYHVDGNVAYKDAGPSGVGNIRPMIKYPAIDKIKKPINFLHLIGFSIAELNFMNKELGEKDTVLSLKNFSIKSRIVCDFYISGYGKNGEQYEVIPRGENPFKNYQSFLYEDDHNKILLQLFFYKSNVCGPYCMIPNRKFLSKTLSKCWYYWLSIKKIIMKFS